MNLKPAGLPAKARIALAPIAVLTVAFATISCAAATELYINEIFLDPGGDGDDATDEYIELRGTPQMSLENHYLIFIENEDVADFSGEAGEIDNIFDLGGVSMGESGFLTIRQKASPYTVLPGGTHLMNDGLNINFGPFTNIDPGYGSGENSTIGASDRPSAVGGFSEGQLENGGFTAMLIHNVSGNAPSLGDDLDVGNDGRLDIATGQAGWEILDSIGVHGEAAESEFGSLYAPVNFGADAVGQPRIPEDGEYVATGWEIEYVGRWGNSTGQTAADWHASNLTDDTGSGTTGLPDWRQSFTGAHPPNDENPLTPAPEQNPAELESTKGVPYGTRLTNTIGGPNFMLGDFTGDGYANLADYTKWRDTVGMIGIEAEDLVNHPNAVEHPAADQNHDFNVNEEDYNIFVAALGGTPTIGASLADVRSEAVPEPASIALMLVAAYASLATRNLRP